MDVQTLRDFEETIDSETGELKALVKREFKAILDGIEEDETALGKEAKRLKDKFFGTATKSAPKKRGRKPSSLPKKASTPEEKAQKKEKALKATGKTIDECKEILAKYEATRKAKNKAENDRLDDLEKKGDLIEGTNVKDAGAVIDDVSEDVKKKIEKEVDQFEKKAEREAKKEVSTTGKTKTEVKKEVAQKVSEKTEKKLSEITKEMSKKAMEFIKDIQSTVAKQSKDDAKEFLMSVRDKIDALLSAYGCGGEIVPQSYKIAWMGGSPSFGEGGVINDRIQEAIIVLDEDEFDTYDRVIEILNPIKLQMPKDLRDKYESFIEQDLTIGEMLEVLEERASENTYAKGGKVSSHSRDMARLSQEPHEQAYKKKRKRPYIKYSTGGVIMLDDDKKLKIYESDVESLPVAMSYRQRAMQNEGTPCYIYYGEDDKGTYGQLIAK